MRYRETSQVRTKLICSKSGKNTEVSQERLIESAFIDAGSRDTVEGKGLGSDDCQLVVQDDFGRKEKCLMNHFHYGVCCLRFP
jgi:hypothetical protein